MGRPVILLDTNVVSEIVRIEPSPHVQAWFDAQPFASLWISSVTLAELHLGIELLDDGRKKTALRKTIDKIVGRFDDRCAAFDVPAAIQFAHVVVSRRRRGRPIEPLDAQIAAIALTGSFTLATLNTRDFEGIEGLTMVDPSADDVRS